MNAAGLLELVAAQLTPVAGREPPTSAADRVRRPGDLPTQPDVYPVLKLRMIGETKQSLGRGTPGWLVTVTIRVIGETAAPALVSDPKSSEIEARLWLLKDEIERAIINSYPLFSHVQQLAAVQTQLAFALEGKHLAGIQSDYTFEIVESGEDFAPLAADEITELHAVDPLHPPIGIHYP